MIRDKIEMILAFEGRMHVGDACVVGVSGGADSVCLLHVMHSLGFHPLAVHVNHHLRPEADQEAETVERFIHDLGVDFVLCDVNVLSYASANSVSVEEAARELRYETLFRQAGKSKAKAVLVAHNADDQVETILMHILRGSGLNGLRGMEYFYLPNPWSSDIPLIRPFLSTTRDEILSYLHEQRLSFTTDPSNTDLSYTRNRLRHELLPYLQGFNPRIRENLLRMARLNQDDYDLIQQLVAEAWQANVIQRGPGYVAFRLSGFIQAPLAIQRYLLRKAIALHLPSLRDIDFQCIQRGVNFLSDRQVRGQIDLVAGLRLLKEGETFWLATWQANLPSIDFPSFAQPGCKEINIPSTLPLGGAWLIQACEETDGEEALVWSSSNTDPFQAWFDLEQLDLPLIVRGRTPGERFQPLGMQGHSIKISDLMVNLKVPRRVRATWPLVCSGSVVIWVPGCRQSQYAQVHPGSRRIAHLTLQKASGT
jgi:tRNA(Ile)-lysidine synthase